MQFSRRWGLCSLQPFWNIKYSHLLAPACLGLLYLLLGIESEDIAGMEQGWDRLGSNAHHFYIPAWTCITLTTCKRGARFANSLSPTWLELYSPQAVQGHQRPLLLLVPKLIPRPRVLPGHATLGPVFSRAVEWWNTSVRWCDSELYWAAQSSRASTLLPPYTSPVGVETFGHTSLGVYCFLAHLWDSRFWVWKT